MHDIFATWLCFLFFFSFFLKDSKSDRRAAWVHWAHLATGCSEQGEGVSCPVLVTDGSGIDGNSTAVCQGSPVQQSWCVKQSTTDTMGKGHVGQQVRRDGGEKGPFLGTWLKMTSVKDLLPARAETTERPWLWTTHARAGTPLRVWGPHWRSWRHQV